MARTSKRGEVNKTQEKIDKLYRAGIYTRLSNERNESYRSKSYSIETQELSCKEYALREDIEVIDTYIDYEYSGTNFDRPGFKRLMEDIKSRRINCILVRDLSRLGREYLEMGRLIDKVFPFLGVRFISVNDKVDTFKESDKNKSFEITLKNIINDMYAKDISVKIKTAKHNRAKNGYFIGSVPPYGYKIRKEKEGQILEIDENTRPIAREMFDLALSGHSQFEIAKIFNEKGYTTAMTYYHTGRLKRLEDDPQWNKSSISKMLTHQVYTGDLVQGVKQQDLARGIKQHYVDESEYIVVPNNHESIITKEEYEKIIAERKLRKDLSYFSCKEHELDRDRENRYKGLIFSFYTGKILYRRYVLYGKNHDKLYYVFRSEHQSGKIDDSKRVYLKEEDLDREVSKVINDLIMKNMSKDKSISKLNKNYEKTLKKISNNKEKLQEKLVNEEIKLRKAYENMKYEKITISKYKLQREVCLAKLETIRSELARLDIEKVELENGYSKSLELIELIYSAKGLEKIPRNLIEGLIEKIVVKSREHIEIYLKFKKEDLEEVL